VVRLAYFTSGLRPFKVNYERTCNARKRGFMEDKKQLTTIVTIDDENTLFGAWTQDKYREDIKLFKDSYFTRPKLFNLISQGKTLDDLLDMKAITRSEATKLLDEVCFYENARKNFLRFKLEKLLERILQREDLDERTKLIKEIEETRAYIEDRVYIEKAKNLAGMFLEEARKIREEETAKYGLTDLDKYTGGIFRKRLVTISARPGGGKSAFCLQVADNVRRQGHKVLYVPTEMTTYENLERLLLKEDIITHEEARTGNIKNVEAVTEYLNTIEKENLLSIYDNIYYLEEIIQKIRDEQPYLVVIDQLSKVAVKERTKDTKERYDYITNQIKIIAKKYDVSILLACQLNREAEWTEHIGLKNLGGSDGIGQDADVVLVLADEDNNDASGQLKHVTLKLVKQRQGENNRDIKLAFYKAKCCFKDSFEVKEEKPKAHIVRG